MNNQALFTDTVPPPIRPNKTGAQLQTRYENAYSDPVHAAYMRSNPRAIARQTAQVQRLASWRFALVCGLPVGYTVAITASGRLTRCYSATLPVYWER